MMSRVLVLGSLRSLVAVCALALPARADCPEGTPPSACALHEEGVTHLTSGRFDEAATKFRAAIAASPSARSYLGYSQAVEGQGKLALAYETMLVAQNLSRTEMSSSGGQDAAIVGRAERIKYKLNELGGRIGFVWLRLPEGVAPARLVSIHRDGEGDLPSPLGRWIPVAPSGQLLIATLDDGTQLKVTATAAPGAQTHLVLPIPRPALPARPGPVPPSPGTQPVTLPGTPPAPAHVRPYRPVYGRPPETAYPRPLPAPPLPATSAALSIGVSVLAPGPDAGSTTMSSGVGLFALYERRVARALGVSARADFISHPATEASLGVEVSGRETMLLAGLRSMTRPFHLRVDSGITVATVEVAPPLGSSVTGDSSTHVYPIVGVGAGAVFNRVRVQAGIAYTVNTSGGPDFPVRFMAVLGFDLWRR